VSSSKEKQRFIDEYPDYVNYKIETFLHSDEKGNQL